jgi:nicotinate-nucleotide adenylyltransferase
LNRRRARRIGVFGGVFDPIHLAHLWIAELARDRMGLDRVMFVPAAHPPHKRRGPFADAEDRYRMVKMALPPDSGFEVSRIELDREGPSYAIDTVAALQRSRPRAEFVYIIGADAIVEIMTWHRARELLEMVEFAAVSRPGTRLTQERLEKIVGRTAARRITIIRGPGVDLSSSQVRRRVREGETIRFIVPAPVRAYIEEFGLYLGAKR